MKSAIAACAFIAGATALSSSCEATLGSLALSSDADCLNFSGLVSLATLSSSDSILPPIETYLSGLCYKGPSCSSSAVSSIATNLTKACGSDLQGLGLSSGTVASLPALIETYYTPAVDALCLRNNNDTTTRFCSSSLLYTMQSSIGQNLTESNIVSSLASLLSNTSLVSSLACTSCGAGIYATLRPSLNSSTQNELDSELSGICGSSFESSATITPSGVVEATGSLATMRPTGAPASSTSGAASSILVRAGMSSSVVGAVVAAGGVLVGSVLVGF